jgi:hypothetical protein
MKTSLIFLLSFALSSCGESSPPEQTKPRNEETKIVTPAINLSKEQVEIVNYLKSGKEPSIKDAHWFSNTHLVVAMNNKGGSYDGWAQTVCLIAIEHGLVSKGTTIEVIDYLPMLKEDFVSLGKSDCIADGAPPTLVTF